MDLQRNTRIPRWPTAMSVLAALATTLPAQGKRVEKPENVKAILLAKLGAFLPVTGANPPAKGQPLRLGVVGSDATVAAALKSLPGRKIDGRPVEIVAFTLAEARAGRTDTCDLLYVATDVDAGALAEVVAAHKTVARPIVAEHAGFAAGGGGIQLFLDGDNVRFQVNQEVLKGQGITPAPQLLNLSRRAP